MDEHKTEELKPPGRPASYGCPECGGTLWEIHEGEMVRYRCRVGHAYSPETLLAEQGRSVEDALWMSLRALEESESLSRNLARRSERISPRIAQRFKGRADEARRHAATIRRLLERDEAGRDTTGAGGSCETEPGNGRNRSTGVDTAKNEA